MKLQFSFLPIPEELMRSEALSFGAKFLFGIIGKANMEEVRWGVEYLSERMGCSYAQTKRRIAELRENNLITVKRTGRTNIYKINLEIITLIEKESRRLKSEPSERSVSEPSERSTTEPSTIKEPSIKKKNVATEVATIYPSFLDKLLEGKQRHIQIIGIWVRERKLDLPNESVYKNVVSRNLRPAKSLVGYKDEDIVETIKVVQNTDYIKKFTLETIGKFIDEVVAGRKKEGAKIIRFEEIKGRDGKITMKSIYAKN